jgi:hypothetical protein
MAESLEQIYGSISPNKKEEDVGFFESALAGVATGLWNIPKGFVSLGAEVYDLIGDTDTAKQVDQWFDEVNPFDDEAEARTIGRITQAITQVAPLAVTGAGLGAKIGQKAARGLAKRAIAAKKAGKTFNLANVGRKIVGTKTGALIGGGAGEALVADEEIGTLADMLKGTSLEPYAVTMMDRETQEGRSEAYRRLMNRLRFGTEGALFGAALVGAGKGLKKLRKPSELGLQEYSESTLGRALQKFGAYGLKPEGTGTKLTLEAQQQGLGNINAVQYAAGKAVQDFDTALNDIFPIIEKNYLVTEKITPDEAQNKFLEEIYDILKPASGDSSESLMKEEVRKRLRFSDVASETGEKTRKLTGIQQPYEYVPTAVKRTRPLFKVNDYQVSKKLETLMNKVKEAGGNPDQLKDAILNFRLSVDNMSAKLMQGGLPKEVSETLEKQLGTYLNTEYKQFNKLNPLSKWKVTAETKEKAVEMLIKDKQEALLAKGSSPQYIELRSADIEQQARDQVNKFISSKGVDQADVLDDTFKNGVDEVVDKATKEEIESVRINPTILNKKVLKPWQEEILGVIKDPRYTFYSTVGKQAHLNYTLRYLDDIKKIGSGGRIKASYFDNQGKPIDIAEFNKLQEFGAPTPQGRKELRYFDNAGNEVTKSQYDQLQKRKFIFNADELTDAQKNNKLQFKQVPIQEGQLSGLSALEGKYVRAPIYDAVYNVTSNFLNRSSVGTAYKYMLLAPKAVSQIAKTILSPLTHVRNFISAGAFAAANGAFFPSYGDIKMLAPKAFGGQGLLKTAYDITGKRVLGTMTKADDELYKRLLNVGVVDSSVQVGESKRLIKDILSDPQLADKKVMRNLLNTTPTRLKKLYGKTQDAYVAEDDFWKVVTWNLERNRYENILKNVGINEKNYLKLLRNEIDDPALKDAVKYFRNMTPRREVAESSFEGFLDELAGNLVRNQVPNYGYVGRTGRALRLSPFGNFIAFPIEIIRTGNNVIEQSIKEITSGIPEISALGYRRLLSFGTVAGGIPLAMTEMFKAQNNVTDEEMEALRKFVPEWSKNSTLLPTGRDENGYLKYIDFSYSNAYDTLIRPFRTVMNEIGAGEATEQSLMNALGKGSTEAVIELLQPFASESIFTEALIDSTFRRGIGLGGRRVWQEEDDPFVKIGKGIAHISKSLTPGSIAQFKRLGQSAAGKSDKYGQTFDLKDELPGLFGFRSIQSNPERGLIYMTTRFTKGLDNAESLFTAPLLRGGRVDAKDIVNRYAYSEGRRFAVLKEMYQNIEAARKLGVSESVIRNKVKRKGLSKDTFNELIKGRYSPKRPSDFFVGRINQINRDLNEKEKVNLPNPYTEARPEINQFIIDNKRKNLLTDNLVVPEIEPEIELLQPTTRIQTPPLQTGGLQPTVTTQQFGNNVDPVTGLTFDQRFATLFPSDFTGQLAATKKRT